MKIEIKFETEVVSKSNLEKKLKHRDFLKKRNPYGGAARKFLVFVSTQKRNATPITTHCPAAFQEAPAGRQEVNIIKKDVG